MTTSTTLPKVAPQQVHGAAQRYASHQAGADSSHAAASPTAAKGGTQPASAGARAKRKRVWLIPREHGAYAQILLPLVTALAVGGATPSGLALGGAFLAAFVATESLRVLLGHRGKRKQQQLRPLARQWLAGSSFLALLLAGLAGMFAPAAALAALLVPAGLGGLALLFVLKRREKTVLGEIVAASALSSCAIPVMLTGGVAPFHAALLVATFALTFAFATLAVHLVVRHKKRPVAFSARLGLGVAALALFATGLTYGVLWEPLAAAASVAALPVLATVSVLAIRVPHPRKLREIGWTLAGMTTLMTLLLIAGYAYVA